MGAQVDVVPELVPARMVNEFAYRPEGAAPPAADGALRSARSVSVSSPSLGLVAVIDIIEGDPASTGLSPPVAR